MSRNGAGVYSVPNTFIAGNTITAAGHNQNWQDLVAEMTNSVAADGQTTITAPLKGANGSQSAPAYSFAADLTSGFWRIGAGNIGIGVSNTKILDIASTGVTITGALVATTLTGGISGLNIIGAPQLTAPANNDTLPIYDLSTTTNSRILLSDFFKVINDFTADASPDISADYVVTYDASATAPKKVLLASIPSNMPRGYIDGCAMSNGTDAVNDINVAAGVCRDITNTADINIAALAGKQLDANWAAGAAAGMRYSGAGIANTTYGIFAARTAASATADIYAYPLTAGTDANTTAFHATVLAALQAETGGSSYAFLRRIGAIVREGGSLVAFTQDGDFFTRTGTITPVSGSPFAVPDSSGHLIALAVPVGLRVRAVVNTETTSSIFLLLTDPSVTDQAAAAGTANTGLTGANQTEVWTNTSAQIRYRGSSATGNLNMETLAWTDKRGRV